MSVIDSVTDVLMARGATKRKILSWSFFGMVLVNLLGIGRIGVNNSTLAYSLLVSYLAQTAIFYLGVMYFAPWLICAEQRKKGRVSFPLKLITVLALGIMFVTQLSWIFDLLTGR